jgi:hypothetical protein
MKLLRYYPEYVDPPDEGAEVYEFKSIQELQENEFVCRWTNGDFKAQLFVFTSFSNIEYLVALPLNATRPNKYILGTAIEGSLLDLGLPIWKK